ncbi:unnamed protein product [Linum tenue]|uniref:Epoxide hydrolase n=1 Tax=Linum tenue TaxID=586396 RepID=A0AAV0QZS2_9ROSI|nr:unnamed protein product [Linum tenue]
MDLVPLSAPLPPWFSDEDLQAYASLTLGMDCGIRDPKVTAPSLLVMGEKDYVLKFAGMEDYIRSGAVKQFVPDLEIVFLEDGNHFSQEKVPEKINELIIGFLDKYKKN